MLAPAGSPLTWAAALEAGANAVYLGLKSFSARAFATNFTLLQLQRVVELTHERRAKIFLAFNSLIKEGELPAAIKTLDSLTHLGPDALIVQDLGLARLIKKYFPQFELHASTLTAVHNMPGLTMLKELGFDRAVLARELTLDEVEKLAWPAPPLGLEIFIHGALCYSVSGLCLMSSFLGGQGSLRGACTQPCRRAYATPKKKGFLFSPTDLEAAPVFERIRQLPLAALKIEGRMKGPDYVSRVVKAYRWLLDASREDLPQVLIEARRLIEASPGRRKTTGFLAGPRPADGLATTGAATSGTFLGGIKSIGPQGGLIQLRAPVAVGDRLRVKFKGVDDQQAFTLKKMLVTGATIDQAAAGVEVTLTAPVDLSPGDLIFLVSSAQGEKEAEESPLLVALEAHRPNFKSHHKLSSAVLLAQTELTGQTRAKPDRRRPVIWFRTGHLDDLPHLFKYHPDRLIVPLTAANVHKAGNWRRRWENYWERLIWALPPVLYDSGLRATDRHLSAVHHLGACEFMVANLGQLPLIHYLKPHKRRHLQIYADYRLNCLNTQTEAALAGLGITGVTLCVETDEKNFKDIVDRPGPVNRILYIYGRPPLFTSRFQPPDIKNNLPVTSPRGERFRVHLDKDLTLVVAEKPVFWGPVVKDHSLTGVQAWIVDLEFDPHPAQTAAEVHQALTSGRHLRSTSTFNLKRNLY